MRIELVLAEKQDMEEIWRMQVEAFQGLLERYQDHDTNPAAESAERLLERYEQPGSVYYFIMDGEEKVGVIRVIDRRDGSRKRISPIWIMPAYRGHGYAQQAIRKAEELHGPYNWCLDTILQEKGNLYLYEKMGYHQTGRVERINDRMDIVFYEKD